MAGKSTGKWLRIVMYIFFGLATAFTLMGGAGTSCVAFNPSGYGFPQLEAYKSIYQAFVYCGLIAGVVQLATLVLLIRGARGNRIFALLAALSSLLINYIHLVASQALGGVPQPVYMVFGFNLLALLFLLVCLIPPVARYVKLEEPRKKTTEAGKGIAAALIACGLSIVSAPFWGAHSHTINGMNYANAWPIIMNALGFGMLLGGVVIITSPRLHLIRKRKFQVEAE